MICPICGKECSESAKFCPSCGAKLAFEEPVRTPVGDAGKQQSVLDTMYRFLKYRRLACKIEGIYMLVVSLILLVCGLICTVSGIAILSNDYTGGFFIAYGVTWFILGILYLPIAIVNFAMVNKANGHMNGLYFNVRPAADYCGSIGQLVLCYFFNTVALVFAIIGFVNVKTNSAVISEIEQNQSLGN